MAIKHTLQIPFQRLYWGPYVYLRHSKVNELQILCSISNKFSALRITNTYVQQYQQIIQHETKKEAQLRAINLQWSLC